MGRAVVYVYRKPLDAIEMISTVIDNNDKHKISVCVQVDKNDVHPVTYENYNDIIKALLYLYYKKKYIKKVYKFILWEDNDGS